MAINPMIYQPSPFMQNYGSNVPSPPPSNNFWSEGSAGAILSQDGAFTSGLDAMKVGEAKLPSGSWLSNQATKFNMGDGLLNKTNNFVQNQAGGWGNVMGGLESLMQVYTGWKAMGLEQDKFDFTRDAWNKNYQAQVKDYENNLRDKWLAGTTWGQTPRGTEQAYLDQRGIG
jgi:hypothetical protein